MNDDTIREVQTIEPQDSAVDAINKAEKRIEHLKKFINLALTVTTERDWVLIQGEPYLQISGAQKIARLFGVCWKNIQKEKQTKSDKNGTYYQYQYTGTFYLAGHEGESAEFIGTCSSRDKFFGKAGGEILDPDEVDELNIMKKAWSNLLNRGIKGILGLNNLSIEMLKNAGINIDKSPTVTYKEGKKGGTSKVMVKKELAEQIRCACLYLASGDEKKASNFYHNEPGKADFEIEEADKKTGEIKKKIIIAKKPDQLTEKHAHAIYGRIKKEFEKLNLDIGVCVMEYGNQKEADNANS